MKYVVLAAPIYATNVSINPDAPDTEARKNKVFAAYQPLKRSNQEPSALMKGSEGNM
jgi:hypothetical protein